MSPTDEARDGDKHSAKEPAEKPRDQPLDSGRPAARWSIILMHACFVTAFFGNMAETKWGGHGLGAANGWFQSLAFALMCLAITLGSIGFLRGWRERMWETVAIASIGLFLGLGTLTVISWVKWREAQFPPLAIANRGEIPLATRP